MREWGCGRSQKAGRGGNCAALHNFNYNDCNVDTLLATYLKWTERLRRGLLEAWPNLMQRHNGLVAEAQTHHLLVLAPIAAKKKGRAIIYELCAAGHTAAGSTNSISSRPGDGNGAQGVLGGLPYRNVRVS